MAERKALFQNSGVTTEQGASDTLLNAVPPTRKVNGLPLSADIIIRDIPGMVVFTYFV